MKKVLVTGATGFVGRHCLGPLVEAGYEVHGLSRNPGSLRQVIWHQVDLLDTTERREVIADVSPTHLLHLAWCTEHKTFWSDSSNVAWAAATLDLATAFVAAGGQRMVATGTCAEYDWSNAIGPLHETASPRKPSTLYGQAKLSTQELLAAYAEETGLSYAWGVLFFLIGPGENPERLVPSVISALLDGRRARLNAGTLVRDFLDIRDGGKALVALLDSGVQGRVNIGSGNGILLSDLCQRIAARLGKPDSLDVGGHPPHPDEPRTVVADVARLRREVVFKPTHTLDNSTASYIEWLRRLRSTDRPPGT